MTTPRTSLAEGAGLPSPETMLTYASILEKPQYIMAGGYRQKIATGEVIEAACAALRFCAALPPESKGGMDKPTLMDPISSEQRISTMVADYAEWAAKWHDAWAVSCRHVAATTRAEWTGPDYSDEDNRANHADARDYDRQAADHERNARSFRAMITSAQNLPAEPVASDDASKLVFPESPSNSGSAGE